MPARQNKRCRRRVFSSLLVRHGRLRDTKVQIKTIAIFFHLAQYSLYSFTFRSQLGREHYSIASSKLHIHTYRFWGSGFTVCRVVPRLQYQRFFYLNHLPTGYCMRHEQTGSLFSRLLGYAQCAGLRFVQCAVASFELPRRATVSSSVHGTFFWPCSAIP